MEYGEILDIILDSARKILFTQEWIDLDLNFSKSELFTLAVTDRHGEIIMSQIAEYIHAPMSTATGVVERLVKKGFLERTRSESDRRVVAVRLTTEGRKQIEEWKVILTRYVNSILEGLTAEEKLLMIKLFQRVPAILAGKEAKGGAEKEPEGRIRKIEIE